MTTRKYMSEAGLHILMNCIMVLQQTDFEKIKNEDIWIRHLDEFPSHIYSIVRRSRILIDESSLTISPEFIVGNFLVRSVGGISKYPFKIRNGLGSENLKLSAPYPHHALLAHDNGKQVSFAKAGLLAMLNGSNLDDHLAFEILYVGQAYGTDGSRTSLDRLASHATLQAIYSNAALETPDSEIWILLWHVTPSTLLMFDGCSKTYEVNDEEDDQHLKEVLEKPISDQQIINLAEASMIRYFKPEFNIRFKDTFPSPAHQTYSGCYQLDLNAVSIEIETEEAHSEIWSKSIKRSARHFKTFPFHTAKERKSMFELVIPGKGSVDISNFLG